MEAVESSDTLVQLYQIVRRQIPDDSNLLDMEHLYAFFLYHNKGACLNFSKAQLKQPTSHFSTSS
jgi:hypothetical protein